MAVTAAGPFKAAAIPSNKIPNHLKLTTADKVTRVILGIFTFGIYNLVILSLSHLASRTILPSSRMTKKEKKHSALLVSDFLAANPSRAERLRIKTADGAQIDGVTIYPKDKELLPPAAEQKWIIFCQGMAEDYANNLQKDILQYAEQTKANLLLFNYRGVAKSKKRALGAKDLVIDGEAAIQYLLSKGVPEKNILIHGYSLGGGVAAEMAHIHQDCAFLDEKSYSSLSKVVKKGGFVPKGLRGIAASGLKLCKWNLKAAKSWNEIKGNKGVVFHINDEEIPYKASLHAKLTKQKKISQLMEGNTIKQDYADRKYRIEGQADYVEEVTLAAHSQLLDDPVDRTKLVALSRRLLAIPT